MTFPLNNDREIRVLHILPTLDVESGVASFVVNHQREISKYGVQFDYVIHFSKGKNYEEECRSLGSRIEKLPEFSVRDLVAIRREAWERLFSKPWFDIIHCGQSNAAFLYAPLAKRKGIPFIQHSHSAGAISDSRVRDVRNRLLIAYSDRYVTDRFACSEAAGRALFGSKDFFVAKNGIDGSRFSFSEKKRAEVRQEFGLKDSFVIACVGRMADQKNQQYLAPIMRGLAEKCPKARLVLVGSGENEELVKRAVVGYGLQQSVLMLGSRDDVSRLYSGFDVMVMPSLYEGLPVAGIEAQFSGLNVLFSNRVTRETSLLPGNAFLSLDDVGAWVAELSDRYNRFYAEGPSRDGTAGEQLRTYDIKNTAAELAKAYTDIVSRYRGFHE